MYGPVVCLTTAKCKEGEKVSTCIVFLTQRKVFFILFVHKTVFYDVPFLAFFLSNSLDSISLLNI